MSSSIPNSSPSASCASPIFWDASASLPRPIADLAAGSIRRSPGQSLKRWRGARRSPASSYGGEEGEMRHSTDRILTSHVGSLPRPDALIEANRARETGETTDETVFQQTLKSAVVDVVGDQRHLGLDIPNDGEFGKSVTYRV